MTGFPPPTGHTDPVVDELERMRAELAAVRDRITQLRDQAEHEEEQQRLALRAVVESTQSTLREMQREHERALESLRIDTERELERLRGEHDASGTGAGS